MKRRLRVQTVLLFVSASLLGFYFRIFVELSKFFGSSSANKEVTLPDFPSTEERLHNNNKYNKISNYNNTKKDLFPINKNSKQQQQQSDEIFVSVGKQSSWSIPTSSLSLKNNNWNEQSIQHNNQQLIGRTKVVAFCNYQYRSIGKEWYHRMSKLGYTTHVLVATDIEMVQYLQQINTNSNNNNDFNIIKYEIMLRDNITDAIEQQYANQPRHKLDKHVLNLLMGVRWKYLLQQLQLGIHILLTDVDNIFTRYIDMTKLFVNDEYNIDVYHAFATGFPQPIYKQQGFVVCSGMSWWRASPNSINFAKIMHTNCGSYCDDQRVLNTIIYHKLNMTWYNTTIITRTSEPMTSKAFAMTGYSNVSNHTAAIWNRTFAYRGVMNPIPCPDTKINWVSMPIVNAKSRNTAWKSKLESFNEWDVHCGITIN